VAGGAGLGRLVDECGGEVVGGDDGPAARVAGEGGFADYGDVADAEAAVAGVAVCDGSFVLGDIDIEFFEDDFEHGLGEVVAV
jgi:hypothetical protein